MRSSRGSKGHAIVELALILPVLMLLALGSLEMTLALEGSQAVTVLSREAASNAYRECLADTSGSTLPATSMLNPNTCLASILTHLSANVGANLPHTVLTAAVYHYDAGSNSVSVTGSASAGINGPVSASPHFKAALFSDASSDEGKAIRKYHTVVVAEATMPYRPVTQNILGIFAFNPGALYAVTIM